MADRMRGMHISTPSTSYSKSDRLPDGHISTPSASYPESSLMQSSCSNWKQKSNGSSWEIMREIEERLEDDDERDNDIVNNESTGDSADQPRLRLAAGLSPEELLTCSPVLPQKILNDLNKPCMEIVLWKSPGSFVKDVVSGVVSVHSQKDDLISDVCLNCEKKSSDDSLPTFVEAIPDSLPTWQTSNSNQQCLSDGRLLNTAEDDQMEF